MTMTSVNKKAALLLFLLERTQALAQSIMLTVHKGWACNRVLGGINKLALSPWGEKLNTQMDVPLSFKHQQLSLRDPFSGELLRSPAVSCELVCRLLALYLAQVPAQWAAEPRKRAASRRLRELTLESLGRFPMYLFTPAFRLLLSCGALVLQTMQMLVECVVGWGLFFPTPPPLPPPPPLDLVLAR